MLLLARLALEKKRKAEEEARLAAEEGALSPRLHLFGQLCLA